MSNHHVLALFDPSEIYDVHWIDDPLLVTQHRIVGARTDDRGRPYALLTRHPDTGKAGVLNWDKIAEVELHTEVRQPRIRKPIPVEPGGILPLGGYDGNPEGISEHDHGSR